MAKNRSGNQTNEASNAAPAAPATADTSGGTGGAKPPVNTDAKLDTIRNAIVGARMVVDHLRATGTGGSKLDAADTFIKGVANQLNGSQMQPVKPDLEAMRSGATGLVKAMLTPGDDGSEAPWQQPTADKATTFINSQAFKV